MFEYSSVSASTYDMAALVSRINERAAEGWRVVSVVTAGAEAVALLERDGAEAAPAAEPAADVAAVGAGVAAGAVALEPEPEPTPEPEPEPEPVAVEPEPTPVQEPAGWGSETTAAGSTTADAIAGSAAAAAAEPVQQAQQAQQAVSTPSVPAGWYPDPSGRFEQRYWDGTQWTEHVARQGQQYTDPPVA